MIIGNLPSSRQRMSKAAGKPADRQIPHCQHRTIALDDVHLVKLAVVGGCSTWQHDLDVFLHGHLG